MGDIRKTQGTLSRCLVPWRKELGQACREYTRIPHRELAEVFGITESAISKMLARGKEGVEVHIKKLHKMSSFQA